MTSPISFKTRTLEFGAPEPEVAFSREEYRRRLDEVRKRMAAAGIDLLYVTNPDHICYLSGYQSEWFQEGGPTTWPGVSGIAVHVDHVEAAKVHGVLTLAVYLQLHESHDFAEPQGGMLLADTRDELP